ncbi:hypothetical protein KBZ10_24995 [Streptomyces sp. F63]|uniref:hypothetical protein n=1 Tax=Streptomyces sp. F63 TaxID=2824887 RepID=UPI001B38650E|nr:hypothetical protein [Streptomyces sp. F63]MBQ0987717.1 hypothetical protein [Streptomyces sp. F63]
MPGAESGEPYRFVVDESSFDFRGLTEDRLTDLLNDFSDALTELREQHGIAVSPWWSETECADGVELYEILYGGAEPRAGRDARLRMAGLMDRCPSWDTELPGLPDQVEIAGVVQELAWSVGYALWQGVRGHNVGCLVFPAVGRRGWHPVTGGETGADVYFIAETSALAGFWRELFVRENVPEGDFFARAAAAFPGLVFAESLTFRKFDGSYQDLRDWVVNVLAVVHDHFTDALAAHPGNTRAVQQLLGSHGITLSPESVKTRSKTKIMKQRDVKHEGEIYRCEWHAKQHPARNRVHFSLPAPRLGQRILVGIFVDHLDTE